MGMNYRLHALNSGWPMQNHTNYKLEHFHCFVELERRPELCVNPNELRFHWPILASAKIVLLWKCGAVVLFPTQNVPANLNCCAQFCHWILSIGRHFCTCGKPFVFTATKHTSNQQRWQTTCSKCCNIVTGPMKIGFWNMKQSTSFVLRATSMAIRVANSIQLNIK